MIQSRLSLAIESGSVPLPADGRIAVFSPRAGADLSALPKSRVQVVQAFRPDHEAFLRSGYETSVEVSGRYATAVVFLPRAKAEARALIAEAMSVTDGGPVVVDGQKTDGIDSILKDCRKSGADIEAALSKAHGKIFVMTGGNFADWAADRNVKQVEGDFVTVPGVFSADSVDRGSALLARALPSALEGRVADLGAGWGYLARQVLQSSGVSECHLVEADHAALECARRNIEDVRARFHWADATTFAPDTLFDHVVTNPPFHLDRSGDPALGREFIRASARLIRPQGTVWLVANRHLPYEAALSAAFHDVAEREGDASFKVFRLSKPRRKSG
jgi:16S rRNA (guanine1207-N2)-methyltransferase